MDVCAGCRNNVEALPEAVQVALSGLDSDQCLNIQIGLCNSCHLGD